MNLQGKYSNTKIIKYPNKYRNIPTNEVVFLNKKSIKDDRLKFTNFLERGLSSSRNQEIKSTICTLIENPEKFDYVVKSRDISIQTRADLKKVKRVGEILQLNLEVPKSNQIIFKGTLSESKKKYCYYIFLYYLNILFSTNRKKKSFSLLLEYEKRKKYKKDIQDVLF